ncbi:MAG: methyl-accepting chemotaxis protein, partial [Verrucomicrobiota bacterium]
MAKTSGPFPTELSPMRASKSPQKNGEGAEHRSRLGRQIIVYFLLISLLPLAIVASVNLFLAKETLIETESAYLEAIASRQIDNIRTYLNETQNIVGLIAENPGVVGVLNRRGGRPIAAERLPGPVVDTHLQRLLGQNGLPMMPSPEAHHEGMRKVVSKLGFSRIYLVNPEGQVVFAIPSLESRYRNLMAPDMAEGELAKLFARTTRLMSTQASDFRIDPATGEPALFISAPVLYDGRFLGVVILAPKNEDIFGVLNDFEGMSRSGEVILAARDGDDILFLNDLRHSDEAAFNFRVPYRPDPGEPMLPVQEAVRGKSGGGLVKDYRGVDVAAGWEYLPGLRMGLVMKVDVEEVFAPINQLTKISLGVAALTALFVVAVAFTLARGITRPIILLTSASNRMADGDLTGEITCKSRNEIGQLSQSARIMAANLKSLIGKVKTAGGEIGKTAQHLSTSARQQVVAAEETGTASVEVNTTAKEISTTAQELASTMQHVNEIT